MPRILLVDDDAVIRVAVENVAAARGWQVDLACDVAQALQASMATPGTYDAAVVDAHLPDGSGQVVADVVALLHPGAHVVLHTCTAEEVPPSCAATAYLTPERGFLGLLDHLGGVLTA